LIKFSLIVDCGIFGTYKGIGLLLDDDTIDIAFKHGQNVVKPLVAMKIEQMASEFFTMMNKAEWQVFRHNLHNPDRNREITITLNKHFSLS
jgi:zona occludens toxin (predicted ATPase)